MESQESHQGSASALATEPKDNTQEPTTNNTAAPNTFTEDEKQLAGRYKVEPKLVRMIGEIVSEHITGFTELFDLLKAKEQVATGPGPGEGPTDEQQEPTRDLHLLKALADVLRSISSYNARFRHEVLTAALEEVSKTTKPADKLLAMEEQVRKICDGLDIKTKAVISVLGELAGIEGYTIGVEYGSDILYGELRGKALVDEARKQLPDDPDLACLAKVYELANSISEAEDKRHVFGTEKVAKEETTKELQTPESEDESPGEVAENFVKQWLLNQNYTTKLASTILACYHIGDHNTEKLADEISNQYEADIMAMAKKPDSSLSSVEVYMTGVVAELLVWEKNM